MSEGRPRDVWIAGDAYERYVGRWSREVAREFLVWLASPPELRWLDVGCGSGALTQTILTQASPMRIAGVESSDGFVAHARAVVTDTRATFDIGDAMSLPYPDVSFDRVVSGLVLNFVSQPARALSEMMRVSAPGAIVALYVWDYAGRMELMRYFWDAAVALDPAAAQLDEGARFPICDPDALERAFRDAGMVDIETRAIDAPTPFQDFDDYWSPFLGGQGPAPGYAMSLPEDRRVVLRERIRSALPIAGDGSIDLVARAWAIRGRAPAPGRMAAAG